MAKISAVIFDFDGTIVDCFPAAVDTINELAQELGYSSVTDQDIELFRHQGASVFLEKLKIPFWKLPSILKRAQEINRPKLLKCPLISGIDKVLLKLKQEVDFLGIISTNSEQTVSQYLSGCYLEIFDSISTSGLFDKHQPMKKMLQRYHLKQAETIYIGDEPRDIKAAHQAGIKSMGVCWGYSAVERLQQEKPTWLIDKPEQLLQIIG